jgi:hypothetical protein
MHDRLQLSAAILAQWQHPVASIKALELLHQAMHGVLYRHTAAAIKMARKVGPFFHHCFVCCCPGGRWGNMEQVVAQWRRPVASKVALDIPILPMLFFVKIAKMLRKYCYEDWVVEKEHRNEDGNEKNKRTYLANVAPTTGGKPTPGRRHHTNNDPVRWDAYPGFIISWISILILQGGHFGSEKRTVRKMWQGSPYGLSIPYVRNSMQRDAFEFIHRHIHFVDNHKQKCESELGYDPLFKVRYVIDEIGKGLIRVWSTGKKLSIEKSMIKYCGWAVAFVLYMPAKPIKHGIKVFVYAVLTWQSCCCLKYTVGKIPTRQTALLLTSLRDLFMQQIFVTGTTEMIKGRMVYSDRGCTGDFSCTKAKKLLLVPCTQEKKKSWLCTQNNLCHPHNRRFPLSMMEANIDPQVNIGRSCDKIPSHKVYIVGPRGAPTTCLNQHGALQSYSFGQI